MSLDDVEMIWQNITTIEAQEQLKMFNAMDWPNLKKNKRQSLHKELFAKAFPGEIKPKNFVSIKEIQSALARS